MPRVIYHQISTATLMATLGRTSCQNASPADYVMPYHPAHRMVHVFMIIYYLIYYHYHLPVLIYMIITTY